MQGIVYVIVAACTGYYFCMRTHRWRYTLLRREGYHVYLYTTGWGLAIALSCICIINLALSNAKQFAPVVGGSDHVKFLQVFIGDAESTQLFRLWLFMAFSFALANIISRIINLFCGRVVSVERAWNDDLDLLAAYSINHRSEFDSEKHAPLALLITTSTRKVYVGYVTATFEPSDQNSYLTIIPIISGYRDKDTLELRLTHRYHRIVEAVAQKNDKLVEQYRQVIARSEISTVHIFYESIYDQVVDEQLSAKEQDSGVPAD